MNTYAILLCAICALFVAVVIVVVLFVVTVRGYRRRIFELEMQYRADVLMVMRNRANIQSFSEDT